MKLIHLLVPEKLIRRIDDFRFAHRMPSRALAIRTLLELALDDADTFDKALEKFREERPDLQT